MNEQPQIIAHSRVDDDDVEQFGAEVAEVIALFQRDSQSIVWSSMEKMKALAHERTN